MDFEEVERILRSCLVEADDTEDGVAHKREPHGYVAYSVRLGRWADARRDAEQLRAALAEAAG